jgi:hypothetical protein
MWNVLFFEASAKTGENIDTVFEDVTRSVLARRPPPPRKKPKKLFTTCELF